PVSRDPRQATRLVRCVSDSPRSCRAQRPPRAAPVRCPLPRCEDASIEANRAEAGSRRNRWELPAQPILPKLLAAADRNLLWQTSSRKQRCIVSLSRRLAGDRVDQIKRSRVLGSRFVVGLDGFVVGPCGIEELDKACLTAAIGIFGDLPHVSGFVEHRALDPLHSVSGKFVLRISDIHVVIDTRFECTIPRYQLLLFLTCTFDLALVFIENGQIRAEEKAERVARACETLLAARFSANRVIYLALRNLKSELSGRSRLIVNDCLEVRPKL